MAFSLGKGRGYEVMGRKRNLLTANAALWVALLAHFGQCQSLPAPTGLAATPGNGVVNLYWNPLPSATAFFIYRDEYGTPTYSFTPTPSFTPTFTGSPTDATTDTTTPTYSPTGTPTPLATVLASGQASLTDFQVVNGDSYVYTVLGLDSSGNLGAPATTVVNPFAPPQAISTLTVQPLHAGALDLSWPLPLSSYPVTGYAIYRLAITFTPNPSGTPTPTPSFTPTPSYTPTVTFSPTLTLPAGTYTSTPGNTYTFTNTFTPTITSSPTPSFTPTATFEPTRILASDVISQGALIGNSSGTSFSDQPQPLGPGEYYYVAIAEDANGNPGAIPTYSSIPNCPQLSKPFAPALSGNLILSVTPTPTNGMLYGVRLQWTGPLASEGVTAYQVFANGTPLATVVVSPTPQVTCVYDDQSVPYSASQANQTQYSVAAVNGNGAVTSNSISENIYEPILYGPIQVTPVAAANNVTISWNQALPGTYGLAGYQIFKSSNGIPGTGTQSPTPLPMANIGITPGVTPTLVYVDSPVTNAWGLSYWVQPYAAVTTGGVFAGATPSLLDIGPTPVATVSVAVTTGNNAFAVTWSGAETGFYGTPVAYKVYREYTNASSPTPVATVSYSQTNYTDYANGVSLSTSMNYQVSVLDHLGNPSDLSPFSNAVVSSSASAPGLPLQPFGLPVLGGPITLTYSWLLNPLSDGVTAYNLYGPDYLTPAPNTPTPVAIYAPTTTPTFEVPATPWAVNNYYVVAQNQTGNSTPTNLSSLAVSQYSVSAGVPVPTQAVTLSWNFTVPTTTPAPLDSFDVYRSVTQGSQFTSLAVVPYPTMVYTDNTASAGQSFYYRVTARSNGVESSLFPDMTPAPEAGAFTWPNAPASLLANGAVSETTLTWVSNPVTEGVQFYTVYQNGTPVATVTPAPVSVLNSVTVPDFPGAGTGYQVVAQSPEGNSSAAPASVLLSFSSGPILDLTPPPGFTPTPNVTPAYPPGVWVSGFTFSSNPADGGVNSYTIYRSINPTPTSTCVTCWSNVGSVSAPTSLTAATPVFVDTNAVSGFTNYYQIVPQNGFGLQGNPNPQTGVSITYFPAAPASFIAQPSASAISLAWAPVGNAPVTGYDIYRSTAAFAHMTQLAGQLAVTTYTDNAVTYGSAYFYWVDAGAQGVTSAPASVTALAVSAPTLFLTPGAAMNNLAWNPVEVPTGSPVSGYSIQSETFPATPVPSQTPGFTPIGPAIVEGLNNTTYADTSVSDPNSYAYQVAVAAPNPWGGRPILGPFSNPVSVIVLPLPVANLEAVSGDGLVQLRWNYQGNQKFTYTIQRKLGSAPVSAYQTIKSGFQGINYTDTGVLNKTLYDYQIYSVDASGLSSSAAMVQALPAEPPYVGNTKVSLAQSQQGDQTGNQLTWAPANNPATYPYFDPTKMYPLGGYYVYRSSDGGGTYQLVTVVPSSQGTTQTSISYFDPVQLVNGSAYTYLVWAFDQPAGVNTSEVNMVHETPYTPITAFPLTAGAALDRNAIRPNGALDEQSVGIRFVVTSPGKVEIKVYSLSGTFIKTILSDPNVRVGVWGTYRINGTLNDSDYHASWDARNMQGNLVASGVYLITVEMNGHQEIDKVAVIK